MPPKRRRNYTISERLELREYAQDHPHATQPQLCAWFERKFNKKISQTTVCESISDKYKDLSLHHAALNADNKRSRAAHWPVLEDALRLWVVRCQSEIPITGDILKITATTLWTQLPEYAGQPTPTWSHGWLQGFQKRNKIISHRRHGKAGSVNDAEMDAELDGIRATIDKYELEDQYNCDETGLFYKGIPDRGLSTEVLPGRKSDATRITIHFACNATGTVKLEPWFVGKYATPRCFRAANIRTTNLAMEYRHNKKAWMTSTIFEEWLWWFDNQMRHPVVMIMDNFSAHILAVENVKVRGLRHTEVVFLPPRTTSKSQPLDQGIIASFKAHYRKDWLRYMLDEVENGRDPQKTFDVLKAIRSSIRAWNEVSADTIANCWRHSALTPQDRRQAFPHPPSLSLEMRADMTQSLQGLQGQESVYQEAFRRVIRIEDLLNPMDEAVGDSSDGDLLRDIVQQFSPEDVESGADEPIEETPKVSTKLALQSISILRLHLEQAQAPNKELWKMLNAYNTELMSERNKVGKQTSIAQWFTPANPTSSTSRQS